MRVLVTGATGRVGSRFEPLARHGAEVLLGDLRDPDALKRAVAGVDAVVNLAAAFRGVPEEETVAVTRDAALALADAALAAGVRRHVLASTNLVYGPGRGRPAREDDRPRPGGAYPTAKQAAEAALLERDGLGLRIVRL